MSAATGAFISGMGVVAPNGVGLDEFWSNTRDGVSGLKRIDFLDTRRNRVKIAGFVRDDQLVFVHKMSRALYDRVSVLARVAADEALRSSGLDLGKVPAPRIAVILGVAMSGMQSLETWYGDYFIERTGETVDAFVASFPHAPASILALDCGLHGPSYTVNTACSSAAAAIGLAFLLIRGGVVDVCITGGADAPLTPAVLQNFERLKVLNTRSNDCPEKACKPFSRDRRGFVLAEGAGILVLESERHLRNRGGRCLGRVIGYGSSCLAPNLLAPEVTGHVQAMHAALETAHIVSDQVDYIHAHGTGTRLNDAVETQAIKAVYGARAHDLPISSVKSMIGHTIGASAALSVICTVCGLADGFLPPTINLDVPDPQCDLNYLPNQGVHADAHTAVVHSFGFGGYDNVLVLQQGDHGGAQ